MITIKKGDREWLKVESWSDVETLPGYELDINPRENELEAVIGKYREPELRVCGLSSCRHKHFRGYIVTTRKGSVTNIGVDCGSSHFGVDFETMSRQLDRDYQDQERRENIAITKQQLQKYRDEVESLINGTRGASWVKKQCNFINDKDDGFPNYVIAKLQNMFKTNTSILTRERQATEKERSILKEMGQNSGTVTDEVGHIIGIRGFFEIEKLKDILGTDLKRNFKAMDELDVQEANSKELAYWSKWVGEIETKLKEARTLLDEGNKFFSRENLAVLAEIANSKDDEKRIMAIAAKY